MLWRLVASNTITFTNRTTTPTRHMTVTRPATMSLTIIRKLTTLNGNYLYSMMAYFCHHLIDNYVDLSLIRLLKKINLKNVFLPC